MSPDPGWPWSVLGLPGAPATLADVRRAYARALKQIDQATDTAGFAALRAAYENATRRVTAATPPTATPPAGVSSADPSSLPLPQPRPAPQALLPHHHPCPG